MIEIKKKPEDFVVEEIIELKETKGDYLYVQMKKVNWNTIDVANEIVKRLKIPRKYIGFAGNKDRNAVTTQYISIKKGDTEEIKRLSIRDVKLEPLFYGEKAISIGSLIGNKFRIKIDCKVPNVDFVENYFGEQRFSENNAEIGKCIIKKDFKNACELIDDSKVSFHIKENKNDYIGALRKLDKNILTLFVNAYQSYLFNIVLAEYLKQNYKNYKLNGDLVFVEKIEKNIQIPLISFDTEFDKDIKEIYGKLIEKEGVKFEDFIIKQLPEVMSMNTVRDAFVNVEDFKQEEGYVEFKLPKGSYATTVIKRLETFLK